MTSKKNWYLHISGETLGPLSTEMVTQMLKQNRVQFTDFVWSEGLTKWVRLDDVDTFAALMPPYPKTPIPNVKAAPAAAGKKPATKAKPAPEPEPEEEEVVEEEMAEEVVEETPAEEEVVEETAEEEAVEEEEEVAEDEPEAEAEPEPEPEPEPEEEEEPAPPPRPAPKKAPAPPAKPAPKPVAKPAPKVAPKPAPKPAVRRQWRVPIDAHVAIAGFGKFPVLDISEGGMLIEATAEIEIGTDLKLHLESPSFAKALDMTGLLVREEQFDGKKSLGIEFTKVNPAHKRSIAAYVKSRLQTE